MLEKITTLKWNLEGHVARMTDNRIIRMEWRPRSEAFRSRGRSPIRRSDIKRIHTGCKWRGTENCGNIQGRLMSSSGPKEAV